MPPGETASRVPAAEPPSAIPRLLPPLLFASAVCLALLAARWGWCGRLRFSGLFGNLLLAWIPLALALVIQRLHTAIVPRTRWLWLCAACWFLFFPNAHYIVTDLVHLNKHMKDGAPKWMDILVIMAHACTGLLLGCASLGAMQSLVRARLGNRAGWWFAVGMLALASFGIYLGRFLRLNSWDVLVRPARLIEKIAELAQPMKAGEVLAFSASFFLFSLGIYWFFASAIRPQSFEREAL
jgi:uncharacterized membrane protein